MKTQNLRTKPRPRAPVVLLLLAALLGVAAMGEARAAVTFAVGTTNGVTNAQVVVPIRVTNFNNISSFQFSFHWPSNVASFVGVEQFGLPAMSPGDFGTFPTGTVTVAWIEPNGGATSLPNGSMIFGVRLQLVGPPALTGPVTIDSLPTPLLAGDENLNPVATMSVNAVLSIDRTLRVTLPVNKVVECGSPWVFDPPIPTDSCGGLPVLTNILSTVSNVTGTCGFITIRTWEVIDPCNNRLVCTQMVTGIDTTPPTITACSTNKTVEFGLSWTFDLPSATDNCWAHVVPVALSTLTNPGPCGLMYSVTRVWEFADGCNNKTTCSQTVNIRDTTPPIMVSAPDKNVNCLGAWSFDDPTATDSGSVTPVSISVVGTITNGSCGAGFTATRTWSGTDNCGNVATCTQTVFGRAIVSMLGTVFVATNYPAVLNEKRLATATVLGPTNTAAETAADGAYMLVFDAANNVNVTPLPPQNDDPRNGPSTLDINIMRRHVLNIARLDSPYKLLAGDVDGTNEISTLDLSHVRRLALNSTNRFPLGLWRYVPADHVFPDPTRPWSAPTNRFYGVVNSDTSGQDFVAIKLGDVNNSWTNPNPSAVGFAPEDEKASKDASKAGGAPSKAGVTNGVTLVLPEVNGSPDSEVVIPILASHFDGVATFQFSFHWDPAVVTFMRIQDNGLPGLVGNSFNLATSNSGYFAVSWDDPSGGTTTLPEGAVLFAARFKLTGAPSNTSSLVINSTPVLFEVTDGFQVLTASAIAGSITIDQANRAPVIATIGNQNIGEGTLLSFTVGVTDPDGPGQTQTFSLDPGAPAGASIDPASGVFSWTPTESQGGGTYPVTVRVIDNGSPAPLSDTETFSITVNELNTAPALAAIGNRTANEGGLLTFTASATDADLPAQTLTFTLDAGAPLGASITAGGVFTWTPTESQGPSVNNITVRVTDNGNPTLSDSETITVTVGEANGAPTLTAIGGKSVNEGTLLSFTATASDNDNPPQTLTFSLDPGAPAGASITAGGAFTWTPTEAQGPNTAFVTVRVTDSGTPALSASETISITVSEVNLAPTLTTIGNKSVNEGSTLSFTVTASDPDTPANTLTYSLSNAPAGATINSSSGAFTWTPTEAQGSNAYSVTVRVIDNGSPPLSAAETIIITVNEIPTAPVLAAIGNRSVNEGSTLSFAVNATDADLPAQTLTYSISNAPAGATFNSSSGAFSWTPTEAQGPNSYGVTFRVTDSGSPAQTSAETITITVNESVTAPVLAFIGNKSVNEGSALNFTATATDADLPAQTLAFSLDAGAPAGASISPVGAFAWTPTEAQGPGSYPVTVRVTDNGSPAQSSSETITITVNELTSAPVLTPIGDRTVVEGSLLTFTAVANDADLPAQTLTFTLDPGAPAGASISAGGAFTWTPTEAQGPSSNTVTIRVTDSGSPTLSVSETITITVTEDTGAPVLAAIGNKSVNEGSLLAFTATATDSDVPAQTLTFSLSNAPVGAVISANGNFAWTPTEAQGPSNYVVTVLVTDSGIPARTTAETIVITVNEISNAPVLGAIGNKSVNEGALLTFTASATDADVPGQTLTFSLSNAPAGASIHASSGFFAWTPTEAQGPNSYVVTVRVTDSGSPAQTTSETITITVNEIATAPVLAAIGNKTVNEGSLLSFNASATDADLPAQSLTFSLDPGAPTGANISSGGVFTWTPTEAQGPSTNTMTVRVTDSGSQSTSETITIVVNELNTAPSLTAIENKTVVKNTTLNFVAAATDTDQPAQTLTFSLDLGAPAGASIHPTSGAFTWTPNNAQGPSTNTITVRVADSGPGALSATSTFTVIVYNDNTPPVLAAIGDKEGTTETLITFTAGVFDAEASSQTLTFSLDAGAPAGASIHPVTGVFTWTPTQAQGGTTNLVTVRVTDSAFVPASDAETIQIIVHEFVAPEISIADTSIPGGSDGSLTAEFEVTLSAPSARPVWVDYVTGDGSGFAGEDYTPTAGTLLFEPGTTNLTIDIEVTGKSTVYTNRTFFVYLGNATNGVIVDGEGLGTLSSEAAPGLYINDVVLEEGQHGRTNAVFTVSLIGPHDHVVTASYGAVKDSALARKDFTPKRGKLKFLPGTTTQIISVPVVSELLSESNEVFLVNLSRPVNAVIMQSQGRAMILDDDPLPFVDVTDVSTSESDAGVRSLAFTVRLSAKSGRAIAVDFGTSDGSAVSGADYLPIGGTLLIPPGQLIRKLTVPILGNRMSESNETFYLNLGNPVNAHLGKAQALGNVKDNDKAPSISVADAQIFAGDSGGTFAIFTVALSAPSEKAITAEVATAGDTAVAGTDYELVHTLLDFAPNETAKNVIVPLLDTAGSQGRRFHLTVVRAVNSVTRDRLGTCVISTP